MLEFMQTIGKGIIQGVKQYIDNDLSSYVPVNCISEKRRKIHSFFKIRDKCIRM